jgi:autotransporter-associated beta strand protein
MPTSACAGPAARRLSALGATLLATLAVATSATGQTWNKTTGGDWGVMGNWNPMAVPDKNALVTLPDILAAPSTITIGNAYTINSLTFDSTQAYTLQGTNAKALLTFDRKGGQATPQIVVNGDNTAANVIAVPLAITSGRALTVFNQGSAQLTISGAISGDATTRLELVNAGQTYLTGTNTYSGMTYINGGNLAISNDAALGAGGTPVRFRAGGVLQGLGGSVTVAAGRELRLFNNGGVVDGILSGDPSNSSNILQVDGKIVNDAENKDKAGRLGILNSVRLTNTNNSFGGASTPIYIGSVQTAGTLYLSSDKVLGNAGNYLDVSKGGIVAEASFASSRGIVSELSTSIAVANKKDTLTWNGIISGSQIVKEGPGTLTLTGMNTYSRTRILGGTVSVSQDANLGKAGGSIFITNRAELDVTKSFATNRALRIGSDSSGRVAVDSGATLTMDGTISGGTLIKTGSGDLKLTKTNSQSMSEIVIGTITVASDAPLGKAGAPVMLTHTGKLHVTDSFSSARPFTIGLGFAQGIDVDKGKTLTITSGLTEAKGTLGSFSKYGDGKLLFAKGSTSVVYGSTSVDAGTFQIDGNYNAAGGMRSNGILRGTGTITGTYTNMGKVAAGNDPPGTLTVVGQTTMMPGSSFEVDINSAIGQAGGTIGWALLDDVGHMDLLGTHIVELDTYTLGSSPGPIDPGLWDPNQSYLWLFAEASDGISGFNTSEFSVDTTGFLSPIGPHHSFTVEQIGNGLYIEYLASGNLTVPEPPSWILGFMAMSLIAVTRLILRQAGAGPRGPSPLPMAHPPRSLSGSGDSGPVSSFLPEPVLSGAGGS